MTDLFLKAMDVLMLVVTKASWVVFSLSFFGTLYLLFTRHARQVKKDKLYQHLVDLKAAGQRALVYEEIHFTDFDDTQIIPDVPSLYDILFTPEREDLLRYLCPHWERSYSDEIIDELVLDADELIVEFADTVHAASLWNWCVIHQRVHRFPADVARALHMGTHVGTGTTPHVRATQSLINQLEA